MLDPAIRRLPPPIHGGADVAAGCTEIMPPDRTKARLNCPESPPPSRPRTEHRGFLLKCALGLERAAVLGITGKE